MLERPIFETARERRAQQEKVSEQMVHEEEDIAQHQVKLRWLVRYMELKITKMKAKRGILAIFSRVINVRGEYIH